MIPNMAIIEKNAKLLTGTQPAIIENPKAPNNGISGTNGHSKIRLSEEFHLN